MNMKQALYEMGVSDYTLTQAEKGALVDFTEKTGRHGLYPDHNAVENCHLKCCETY